MTKQQSLRADDRGTATIEMAICLPVLVLMLWGIFQLGIAFQASAGMQHALGEGARLATICQSPTARGECTSATNDDIKARIAAKTYGTGVGTFTVPDVEEGAGYRILRVNFEMPMNFLFFNGPTVRLAQTKRVYVAT